MIEYKGEIYPEMEIYVWKYKEWHQISVESLSNVISKDGTFDDADDEGIVIDSGIFFYIPDDMMERYNKMEIMKYINSQL